MKGPPRWQPTIRRVRRSRLLALAGLAAAVLATHLWLLQHRAPPRHVAAVTVTLPRPTASADPTDSGRRADPPPQALPLPDPPSPSPSPRPTPARQTAATPQATGTSAAVPEPRRHRPAVTAMHAPSSPTSTPASAATAPAAPGEGPRIAFACPAADRSALPPPVEVRYSLQRGRLRGEGQISWRHDAQHYRLSLEAQLPLAGTLLRQTSEGDFDRCGLAPLRHTDKRLGRSERALSVLRPPPGSPAAEAGEAGELRFSGRSVARALEPGTQDRLSWLVQLSLQLTLHLNPRQADLATLGPPVEIAVASVSGDVQHWVFTLLDRTPDGLLHLRREPEGPYETHAEVWVDPQRGHWPVRLELSEARGDPLLLQLIDWRPAGP